MNVDDDINGLAYQKKDMELHTKKKLSALLNSNILIQKNKKK